MPVVDGVLCPDGLIIVLDGAQLSANITACIACIVISMGGQFGDFLSFGGRAVGAGMGTDTFLLTGCRCGDDACVIAVFSRLPLGQGADSAGFGNGAGGFFPDMLVPVAGEFTDGTGPLGAGAGPIVIAQRGSEKTFVISVNSDAVPLIFGAAVDDLGQTGALVEGVMVDAGHSCGDGNCGQVFAVVKSILFDFGHAIWDIYAGQIGAPVKCPLLDIAVAVRKVDADQITAILKCAGINVVNIIGDFYAGQAVAVVEGAFTDACDTVGNCNRGQLGAVLKCSGVNGEYAFGKGNTDQIAAFIKSKIANVFHTIRNNDAGQSGAAIEGLGFDVGNRLSVISRGNGQGAAGRADAIGHAVTVTVWVEG